MLVAALPNKMLLLLAMAAVSPFASQTATVERSAFLWFWGCDDDDPGGTVDAFFSELAPAVFSQPASPDFVTGLIPACGYNIGDALPPPGQPLAPLDRRGGFTLPCCSELHGLLSVVNRSHARGMRVLPLLTGYTDTGPGQLRAFVSNMSLVRRYIETMVQETITHDYDGFSFDWEYRGWNADMSSADVWVVIARYDLPHDEAKCGANSACIFGPTNSITGRCSQTSSAASADCQSTRSEAKA